MVCTVKTAQTIKTHFKQSVFSFQTELSLFVYQFASYSANLSFIAKV